MDHVAISWDSLWDAVPSAFLSSATKRVQDGQDQSQLGQCCSLSGHGKFDLFLAAG